MSSLIVNNHKKEIQLHLPNSDDNSNQSSLIPQNVILLLQNTRNKQLEEMCYKLINFKHEINDAINNNQNIPLSIPHYAFRSAMFNELEIILTQCSYLNSSDAVSEKINETYKWFKDKMKKYFSISSIKHKSALDKYELHSMMLKEEEIKKALNNDNEDKQIHRTKYKNGFNIKLYKVKKIKLNDNKNNHKENRSKSLLHYEIQNESFKKGLHNYSINDINKAYVKKNEKNSLHSNNDDDFKEEIFEPDKDIKASYSYCKPTFNVSQASIEQRIIKEKQKQIQEKRSLEQMRIAMDSYGEKRGLYKGNQLKSSEMKKVAKYYQHKLHKQTMKRSYMLEEDNENKVHNISLPQTDSKVNVSNMKNISVNTYIINPSINETQVTINLKLQRESSLPNLLNTKYENNNYENIPSDAFYIKASTNSIFASRLRLMNFEYESTKHRRSSKNRLSLLYTNIYNTNNNGNNRHEIRNSNSTKAYISNSIGNGNGNFLQLRRSLSSMKLNDSYNLGKYHLGKDKSLNRSAIYSAFINPDDSFVYPKYYLPSTQGEGLLTRSPEKDGGKEGIKQKRKRK